MPGIWDVLFFVWAGFFVPSYSTLVLHVSIEAENSFMSSDASIQISIFWRIASNVLGSWGCLALCHKSCTAVSDVCWSVAYLLPIASLIWKGFFAHLTIFFSSSKSWHLRICSFAFFEEKSAVHCWSDSLIVQIVPWYLSHCTCFCFAHKQAWVNWVSRMLQVRKPTVAKRATAYTTEYDTFSFLHFPEGSGLTNSRIKQIVDVGNQRNLLGISERYCSPVGWNTKHR